MNCGFFRNYFCAKIADYKTMKITFRGKRYQTLEQCYGDNRDATTISLPLFITRVTKQGFSVEKALTTPDRRSLISHLGSHLVEGVEYINLPSIARAYGLNESLIYRRYFNGHRGNDLIPPKLRKDYVPPAPKTPLRQVEIGGVKYRSIAAACRALGVRMHTYANRRRTGRTLEECLGVVPFVNRRTLDVKTFEIDGETLTYRQIEEKYNIDARTFSHRLKRGMTTKEAVTAKVRSRQKNEKTAK